MSPHSSCPGLGLRPSLSSLLFLESVGVCGSKETNRPQA
jgi:hypothetical protein